MSPVLLTLFFFKITFDDLLSPTKSLNEIPYQYLLWESRILSVAMLSMTTSKVGSGYSFVTVTFALGPIELFYYFVMLWHNWEEREGIINQKDKCYGHVTLASAFKVSSIRQTTV